MLPVVREMAKLGAVDLEIAQALGVSLGTVELWARTHPRFLRALKPPKKVADERVARSLFKRATGYSYPSEEIFLVDHEEEIAAAGPDQPKKIVRTKKELRVPTIKHVPPDSTSAIFWLKNRRKDEWRDFKATEISTPPGRPFEVQQTGPTEPELIGAYYKRLASTGAAPQSPDTGSDPGVGSDRSGPTRSDGSTSSNTG